VAVDRSKLSHKAKEKKKRKAFTEFEYKHIMRNAEHFHREATALAWWTGMRFSDIARLEWDSIDFKAKTLTVHTKKTDARICLPLMDPLIGGGVLLKILTDIEVRHDDYCFPEQRALDMDPSKRATLSTYYGRMLARLNISGKSFHCLRHSFVTRCKKEGKTLEEIALWVGHSSEQTTEIYDHQKTTA
jgi:integrase